MSRFLNHIGSFFPRMQKDFKIYDGDVFSEIYDGDYYADIPYDKYINYNVFYNLTEFVSIKDFGAIPENPSINNADVINSAIKKCYENGGGVVLIDGGNYTCGTIYLRSNVTLYINKNSSIIASHNTSDFTDNSLIYAENCENSAIIGPGKICGEGNYFSLKPHLPPKTKPFEKTLDVWDLRQEYRKRIRFPHKSKYGYLVLFRNCSNIRIHNLVLENSAMWTVNINSCINAEISNIVINNNRHVANTDGIDICGSSNVVIKNCFISTADDGIVLKNNLSVATSGDDGLIVKNNLNIACKNVMSNIIIYDCEVISCTNAFKIGTETSLDICDVTVKNCKFYLKDIFPAGVSGVSIESCDGAVVNNICITDIEMDSMACPVFIRLCNRNGDKRTDLDGGGEICDVKIKNITANNIQIPVMIMGIPNQHIKNVQLENFDMSYATGKDYIDLRFKIPEQEREYPECNRFRNINAYGIFVRHADNILLKNFKVIPRDKTHRKFKIIIDSNNFKIDKE